MRSWEDRWADQPATWKWALSRPFPIGGRVICIDTRSRGYSGHQYQHHALLVVSDKAHRVPVSCMRHDQIVRGVFIDFV